MSGEFGKRDYAPGFIDDVLHQIANDCLEHGNSASTRMFGAFLHQVATVAHTIAYNEAGDSSPIRDDLDLVDPVLRELLRFRDTYLIESMKSDKGH